MAFDPKLLNNNEEVLLDVRPHWWFITPQVAMTVVAIVVTAIVAALGAPSIVLYILAVGNVRGFAFTLGITVVIDVIVVVLFTHPMLQLLASTRFFSSGHPLSGLDPRALGAVYRGRAQFRTSVIERKTGASREAVRRQTIAERKAAGATATKERDD